MTTQQKFKIKLLLTIFIIYQIAIICILTDTRDTCQTLFSTRFCHHDGFQYVVMCLFVPTLFALIYNWKSEIIKFFKFVKNIFSDVSQNDTQTNNKTSTEFNPEAFVAESIRKNKEKSNKKPTYGWQEWE